MFSRYSVTHVLEVKVQRFFDCVMDTDFGRFPVDTGMGDATMCVLEEECVLIMEEVLRLREQHFDKLLPKITVGG